MIPDSSLERYFTEAIYRDDVQLTLRYIVLAIYRRNDVSCQGVKKMNDISPIYRRYIGRTKRDKRR